MAGRCFTGDVRTRRISGSQPQEDDIISDVDASPLHPVVSREWRLSPAYIEVLLHCHCHCSDLPNRDAPVVADALRDFMRHGLIVWSDRFDHGWQTTAKGRALVEMLCRTPLPVDVLQDPRTGETVG
jgi:hypothetical protein